MAAGPGRREGYKEVERGKIHRSCLQIVQNGRDKIIFEGQKMFNR